MILRKLYGYSPKKTDRPCGLTWTRSTVYSQQKTFVTAKLPKDNFLELQILLFYSVCSIHCFSKIAWELDRKWAENWGQSRHSWTNYLFWKGLQAVRYGSKSGPQWLSQATVTQGTQDSGNPFPWSEGLQSILEGGWFFSNGAGGIWSHWSFPYQGTDYR